MYRGPSSSDSVATIWPPRCSVTVMGGCGETVKRRKSEKSENAKKLHTAGMVDDAARFWKARTAPYGTLALTHEAIYKELRRNASTVYLQECVMTKEQNELPWLWKCVINGPSYKVYATDDTKADITTTATLVDATMADPTTFTAQAPLSTVYGRATWVSLKTSHPCQKRKEMSDDKARTKRTVEQTGSSANAGTEKKPDAALRLALRLRG